MVSTRGRHKNETYVLARTVAAHGASARFRSRIYDSFRSVSADPWVSLCLHARTYSVRYRTVLNDSKYTTVQRHQYALQSARAVTYRTWYVRRTSANHLATRRALGSYYVSLFYHRQGLPATSIAMSKKRPFSPRLLLALALQSFLLHTTHTTAYVQAIDITSTFSTITSASAAVGSQIASTVTNLDYRYFVAGGVCAATSHGITTPIDVVKTRMQADPKRYDQGVAASALKILKEDGPSTLLGGLGPTVVGYGIEGAMKFGLYEVLKPVFVQLLSSLNQGTVEENTGLAFILASIVAGAVASIILCPMESTRIRIVTDPAYADKGLITGLPKLIREEGLASTFAGVWAMLAKQVPYTMAKQVSFDVIAKRLYSIVAHVGGKAEDFKWIVSVDAAFFASILACIFSQPGDMILTETYKGKSDKGVWGVVNDIYNEKGGVSGFFTGTSARILHVGVIITTQLVIYDIVKQLLGLPATGSH